MIGDGRDQILFFYPERIGVRTRMEELGLRRVLVRS